MAEGYTIAPLSCMSIHDITDLLETGAEITLNEAEKKATLLFVTFYRGGRANFAVIVNGVNWYDTGNGTPVPGAYAINIWVDSTRTTLKIISTSIGVYCKIIAIG